MSKPLQVAITVGTSFSYGVRQLNLDMRPVGDRSVLCEVGGQGHGLDFLLNTFLKFNTRASFFVETAQSCYFGDEPMANIVRKIQAAKQDTQMMLQPAWFYYDESAEYPLDDNLIGRERHKNEVLIGKALETYQRLTGESPDAIRFAQGKMDTDLYGIIDELGIPMSSTIAMENGASVGKELFLNSGRKKLHGVMEVPLFTYQDKDSMGSYPAKTLQMATCSWREMRHILTKARKMGLEQITLLTQPSDYVKCKDERFFEFRPNRVNQNRLEKLCSFINEHDQDFESADFGRNVEVWKKQEVENIKRFKIPTSYRNLRKIENGINHLFWNY